MKKMKAPDQAKRMSTALTRFAIAITLLNVFGHLFLGFEQPFWAPLIALATAYGAELFLESWDARLAGRRARFRGRERTVRPAQNVLERFVRMGGVQRTTGVALRWRRVKPFVMFLRSAHITALACAMLLYPGERMWPIVLAVLVAIGSKFCFRVKMPSGASRHIFNPSNFGITITLLLLPWVGIAPPYQFTESLTAWEDWIIPVIIVCTGSLINLKLTRRGPLILGWVGGFSLQAIVRGLIHGEPIGPKAGAMTGVAFILFTFYMITDPMTTPEKPKPQFAFGFCVAMSYWALMEMHIVFGIFFGLTFVCLIRGLSIAVGTALAMRSASSVPTHAVVFESRPVPVLSEESAATGGGQP